MIKSLAIVLRTIKYSDGRVIVDMFTRQQGRLSFIVPLPKSPHAKIKKQYFQPLTLLDIEANVRPLSQLQTLRDASLSVSLSSILSSPDKLAVGLFVSEFLYHALRDEQQNEPLFDYIRSSIEWLEAAEAHYANFHLVFLMRLSRFLGFYPNLTLVKGGGWRVEGGVENEAGDVPSPSTLNPPPFFDLRNATFCTEPPLHPEFLMPEEAAHIRVLMRMDFFSMHLFRLSRAERNRILEILLLYYRLHLPAFPELKSVEVLRELYSS